MTRFEEITKDIELFSYIIHRVQAEGECTFCFYNDKTASECHNMCRDGIELFFQQEVK